MNVIKHGDWIKGELITGRMENKAIYTATKVSCAWAGAVMKHANKAFRQGVGQKPPTNAEKLYQTTDRPKDRHSRIWSHVHETKNMSGSGDHRRGSNDD